MMTEKGLANTDSRACHRLDETLDHNINPRAGEQTDNGDNDHAGEK